MLREFRVENYKSFLNEAVFSMEAAPKQSGLDYSLMKQKIKRKVIKGLSSSVIYGPNAAGKTNIIGAMDTFRSIVIRGNIKNTEENKTPNVAAGSLELIPNNTLKDDKPVTFSVSFIENDLSYFYRLVIDLGMFLDATYNRKVLEEELSVNDEKIFVRDNKHVHIRESNVIKEFISDAVDVKIDEKEKMAEASLHDEDLFLTNGFKLIFSPKLAQILIEWFTRKFMVIYRADSVQYTKKFSDTKKQSFYIEKATNDAAKIFGINSNAIGYIKGEEDGEPKLCSFIKEDDDNRAVAMLAEAFESYGTVRFVNMFPLLMTAIKTGSTLVVDEFDASLHPMALMSIINVFHNDEINKNHAQLVFNTHNPIFLNSNLLRRDEIKFVERDEKTGDSILYALSDFGTSGVQGVRKNEDYLKCYFIGRYGAIRNIDFTPVFEQMMDGEGRDE